MHLFRQRSSSFADVEHRQHDKNPIDILCQAAVANLGKAPQALQNQKRVLDAGAHAGLAPVLFFVRLSQKTVLVGAFVGKNSGCGAISLSRLRCFFALIGLSP